MAREELMVVVRDLVKDSMQVRFEGAAYAKQTRVHGYADGYMKALLDAGLVDRKDLLKLVTEERSRHRSDKAQTAA